MPQLRRTLPVLQTGAPTSAATEFVRSAVTQLAPHAVHRELARDGALGIYDDNRLIAYSNPTTGQSHVIPLLDGLQPNRSLRTVANAGIRNLLTEQSHLFDDDVSRVVAGKPISLMASNHTRRGTRTTAAEVLSVVKLRRQVGNVPVFGPGSSASAAFSHNGMEAFNHRWSTATLSGDRIEAHPPRAIVERVVEHLGELPAQREVQLRDIKVAYFDDGKGTLQPVYRYRVTLPSKDGVTAPGMLVGYVPIGELVADLPSLYPTLTNLPKQALQNVRLPRPYTGTTVGRYVVREDNDGWVASANSFWDGVSSGAASVPGGPSFKDSQYYWAEPRLFLDEKDSFVNSVNLALTEVHGNWGLFSTYKNYGDLVRLSDIPSTGYGGDARGALAYWIVHSCEVIPTQTDETTSFDVWWNIFNGLHAAMGYRTEMWINDEVSAAFGNLVGLGASVVSSWLNTVINDNDYQSGDTYFDDNRNMTEPMGRPAAVAVTGHGDDTAMMIDPLPKPSSLTEWWFDN
ncbi:MAG: hypothetical protein DLM57_18720 [Pseudonocardiales bacterium]|nr:MAG: hypothetical protein DLM57_18720 [Pseudonocardiales bacterium]